MKSAQPLFSDSFRSQLVSLRRELHRHPELAFKEEQTASRLEQELQKLGAFDVRRVAGTGVVAQIRGRNSQAPVVAIRGDIDALPIQEETGLEFASTNPGVMHACGHDVHAAWTLGAAHLLLQNPAQGDVIVVFQPAEEIGKGAVAILKSGALDGVSAIFGGHVDRRYPVGRVVAHEGPIAASSDEFHVELIGRGAHAARPHEAIDPIVGASALIMAIQTIVSRRINPASPAVITVGTVHAGSAPNVIPDRANFSGTIRAVDQNVRRQLLEELRNTVDAVAKSYKLAPNLRFEHGTPPIVNPAEPLSWARKAIISVLGEDGLAELESTNLAAEDFAYYMEKIPGCFLRVGAREDGGKVIPAHSSKFYAAEESILVGAAVLAETARVASSALASR
jgi:hippurate hydrolase